MKKAMLVTLVILAFGMFAMAQIQAPTSDVLGAHLNYGRGCAGCHAPHSGERGNGINNGDTTSGQTALWGQNVFALYGQSFTTGGGRYVLTIPNGWSSTDPVSTDTATCLSCHDGNLAQGAMMKNKVYETVPSTYSSNNIPTLLGNSGNGAGDPSYLADHPVGDNATIGCGGSHNWDCTIASNGQIIPGPKMLAFIQNYGFFVSPATYLDTPTVQCTTCHNQHLMNVVAVTNDGGTCSGNPSGCSGLPSGNYATMFFIRAPYNPASGTAGSNQAAQFCRQCHGGESNELNGSTSIPTTF